MSDNSENRTTKRKKKASRACGHCQKAHLTCDDMRPCSRCVKRDLASTCADGARKKAKYLQDVDALSSPAKNIESNNNSSNAASPSSFVPSPVSSNISAPANPPPPPAALPTPDHNNSEPNLLSFPLAPNFNFGSEAVNLEYSFLSNMLGNPPLGDPNGMNHLHSHLSHNSNTTSGFPLGNLDMNAHLGGQQQSTIAGGSNNSNAAPIESMGTTNSPVSAPEDTYPDTRPTRVYKAVLRPYDYREGFHSLVRYVKGRMEKNDVMRICRALAQFRPSFMAQIMNLSEEDLVFMEKCFQRTIMEFDKLIGFSGTPTAVWRRTGEVALVGKEFSILTQWPREQLLGKKTYIYELMDNSSAVDYWEKFSLIAFDNSQQSIMTTCTLMSPSGRPVPCAFCFTIKRDIFDVPLAIVGNFLPL
ncbi:hypothetical protein DFJ77DRAFT_516060 [Powellomyces hirtus]|nr:hypothetical protein DFJ77DRAFT_516060 [Powellomyces hirtus]